jgi:hypothetical protein
VRLFILAVAGVGLGALSGIAILNMFPQQSASMLAAVRALPSDAARFRVSNLNPIRAAYDDVKRKITSGDSRASLNLPSSKPIVVGGPITLPKPVVIDQDAMRRAIAAGVNARIQQDYQRSQAMIQYGRNPMGWHGAPPH